MLEKINDNIIYFDNDKEFYEFCVIPNLVVNEYIDDLGNVKYYTDFDFSSPYLNAIKQGKKFMIMDSDSQIFKHQAVSYRTITKPIENLEQYFDI